MNGNDDAIVAAKQDAARNNFDDADADVTITVNIPPTGGNYAGCPVAAALARFSGASRL